MKRIVSLVLVCMMCVGLVAVATAEGTAGGWVLQGLPASEMPEALAKYFADGMDGLTGVGYTPIAYLATQVVAGINHLVLCTGTVIVPDGTVSLNALVIYEDLSGNFTVSAINEVDWSVLTTVAE